MSVFDWPQFKAASFRWRKVEQAIPFKSVFGSQSLTIAAPRWEVDMTGVTHQWEQAKHIITWLESLNGYSHQVALYNLAQPVPAGTMRGTLKLATEVEQGEVILQIDGGLSQAGRTLFRDDLIGLGTGMTQHVVRITADAVADGSGLIVISIGSPLRNDFSADTPVIWDRPRALFRQRSLNEGIQYVPKFGQPWTLSLTEDWRP